MERDTTSQIPLTAETISTHTLTWSVTKGFGNAAEQICISTHTLTWSVTIGSVNGGKDYIDFNSHAHVERDGEDFRKNYERLHFNSHAHVERDLNNIPAEQAAKAISTHTLTWSVTKRHYIQDPVGYDFNSHAHVERDFRHNP